MKVSELGEFGLIDRIARAVERRGRSAHVGIGDDTAVLQVSAGKMLLATVDVLVEGVHFRVETTSPSLLGARALAVNLSDIAAMGGHPRYVLVSLGLPGSTPVDSVDQLYEGMLDQGARYGVEIAGGNVTSSPQLIIDVALLGEVEKGRTLLRSGARAGDSIMVTGTLGASAAGLALLSDPAVKVSAGAAGFAIERHRSPVPRLAQGQALAASGVCTAMIDISDGLAADLRHICEASRVGAVIDAESIPIHAATKEIAAATGQNPLSLALFGGEDYELLFTVRPGLKQEVERALHAAGDVGATRIGQVVDQSAGVALRRVDGTVEDLPRAGYQHLREDGN